MAPLPILLIAAFTLALTGCAVTGDRASGAAALADELPRHAVVLLGEVHDNPHHHRLRHEALRIAVERGYRPALLMEQFDRESQPAIERARRERPGDAGYLIALAAPAPTRPGVSGWHWPFYKPFVELALKHDLPIIAANASRADLMRVAKDGFAALFSPDELQRLQLDQPVPSGINSAQEREIASGHCNALPPAALAPMARAQIARDAFMALKIDERKAGGAILLAGNSHVRRDIGVPRWLRPDSTVYVVGYLEAPADGATAANRARYDHAVITPAAERPDPCAAFLKSRTTSGATHGVRIINRSEQRDYGQRAFVFADTDGIRIGAGQRN